MQTQLRPGGSAVPAAPATRGRWSFNHALALLGVGFLLWQAVTWTLWLLAGPEQITEFRDRDDVSWYAARVVEVLVGVLFAYLLVRIVRQSRREGRLVLDGKLFLAGLSIVWLDPWTNIFAPIWLYSSQFVNLNNPLAFSPLIVNPDFGRIPFPVLFHSMNYPVALVMAGMLVSTLARRIRTRWPSISVLKLLGALTLLGIAFDLAYEMPFFQLQLWAFPGTPDEFALFGKSATKFPIYEFVPAGMAFASFGALRYFKNDKGEALTERGLERHSPGLRATISTLSTIAVVHVLWIALCTGQAVVGLYADPYKPMPAHLINDLCDAPLEDGGQITGTRYGPCPEQGYDMPVRKLPGPRPYAG